MTQREFYTIVSQTSDFNAEVRQFAVEALLHMDLNAEKRKAKAAEKTNDANAPLIDAIQKAGLISTIPVTAAEVGQHMNITSNKASAVLRKMVAMGLATQGEAKVPGKGTVKCYSAPVEA